VSSERWDFTTAAHLLNRVGFGGPPAEIDRLVALDPARTVSQVVDYERTPGVATDPGWAKPDPGRAERLRAARHASPEERKQMQREEQKSQREHIIELRSWWLQRMAKLIGGGLPTRVFYVSQGGYDSHTNQANTQECLLRDLGDSVKAFVEDMQGQGNLPRVLVMTLSEFRRRVAENANGGTDYGAAAPMFVVGDKVKAGLLGRYPSLAPADLFEGDLKYNVDFRSVYAGVLENWLRTRSEPVLGRNFPPLQIV
jgi:uncharacterized protein (DUF1501 family)